MATENDLHKLQLPQSNISLQTSKFAYVKTKYQIKSVNTPVNVWLHKCEDLLCLEYMTENISQK
jgi:hypothetical protein